MVDENDLGSATKKTKQKTKQNKKKKLYGNRFGIVTNIGLKR